MKVSEENMRKRRIERLKRAAIFMGIPEMETVASRPEVLNLLTGWFDNSHWRTAWWVFTQAVGESYVNVRMRLFLLWHRSIMRRSDEEIDLLLMEI